MSRISGLSDDLLIKILSYLPTKVAVSTSILSKQWQFLWMWSPKLEYDEYDYTRYLQPSLQDFIDKNLPLHRTPVIESLRFKTIYAYIIPEDIQRWIEIAVSRHVRELDISYLSEEENIFPSNFYTCNSLVILKLEFVTLTDVPSMVCRLPSLKTLQLEKVVYKGKETLQGLLSICPVLEELSIHFDDDLEVMEEITIIVPSLQRLSLSIDDFLGLERYVIDTPCLKYFKLEDHNSKGHYCEIKNMPKLREAYVDVVFFVLKSVLGSITSVNRLTICAQIRKEGGEDDVYGGGFVFKQLQHLKLCLCKMDSSNLLGKFLKGSPNLQVLDISHMKDHGTDNNYRYPVVYWNQPSDVPKCLLSCLQIFKWSRYFRRPQDIDIGVYILKNARLLSTTTILGDTIEFGVSKR
ncbi:unnamed protein product [Microthlaspi erraticum]|uniref:F-box domain-containing protein n=1 Tax=Microthlaspi erraticum TaxID=1685480 RepID=A0A6D2L366_9BRAS|nr:unnamed protein product [Microthlaspi erraticum]